jgi:hypothetical protein
MMPAATSSFRVPTSDPATPVPTIRFPSAGIGSQSTKNSHAAVR